MESEVAPLTAHVSVDEPPGGTELGVAVKEEMPGAPCPAVDEAPPQAAARMLASRKTGTGRRHMILPGDERTVLEDTVWPDAA
jgi:hypothetical protein